MIEFTNPELRLKLREAEYWKKVFSANLMIGTEIEIMFSDDNISSSDVSRFLRPLNPGGSPGSFRSYVELVTSDGSLSNGGEILTPGRRIYGFLEQFSMFQNIYSHLRDNEPIIDPRMGWHNHIVLQDYDGVRAREMPIPRIIFDNLMLLCKKYYPALAFMSSTMPNGDANTRYNNFCRHDRLLNLDIQDDIDEIKSEFHERYNCVNINNINNNGDEITTFHIEFRFPDGTLFPIQMASLNILFKALVLKAINISKIGLLDVSTMNRDLYNFKNNGAIRARDIDNCITTPDPNTRLSGKLNDSCMAEIISLSEELVTLLTPEINSIDGIALPFLKKFAKTPISYMFEIYGTNDLREINDILEEELDTLIEKEDNSVLPLIEVIESGVVKDVESLEDWINKVNALISYKEPINDVLNKISKTNKLRFNKQLGFYFE